MKSRRAFTLADLAAILAAGVCLLCIGAAVFGHQPGGPRDAARQKKDSQQVRGIQQSFVVWAQNNGDLYPLPSKIDEKNNSVTDNGTLKDTTANVYSLLVFVGAISTDTLVSPVEKNPSIEVYAKYEFDRPRRAANPEFATWDPAFSVDFTGDRKAGASYAHLQPSGGRLKRWTKTSNATEKTVGMRGPEVSSVTKNEDGSVTPTFANPKSNTFSMYEEDGSWSGNMAFNDTHVEFLKRALVPGKNIPSDPKGARYSDADGKSWPDLWNYDEPDDPKSVNEFLGIFTRAGAKPAAFKAIWD